MVTAAALSVQTRRGIPRLRISRLHRLRATHTRNILNPSGARACDRPKQLTRYVKKIVLSPFFSFRARERTRRGARRAAALFGVFLVGSIVIVADGAFSPSRPISFRTLNPRKFQPNPREGGTTQRLKFGRLKSPRVVNPRGPHRRLVLHLKSRTNPPLTTPPHLPCTLTGHQLHLKGSP